MPFLCACFRHYKMQSHDLLFPPFLGVLSKQISSRKTITLLLILKNAISLSYTNTGANEKNVG